MAIPYAVAAAFVVRDLRGLLHDPVAAVPRASGLRVSLDATHRITPLGPFGSLAYAGAVGAAGAVLVIAARAYLAGHREALAVVVGSTVLLATSLNDLGVAAGLLTIGYLVDAGLAAFAVGLATTPSARYAAVHRELALRTRGLRTRSRDSRSGEGTPVTVFLPHGSPSEPPPRSRSAARGLGAASERARCALRPTATQERTSPLPRRYLAVPRHDARALPW